MKVALFKALTSRCETGHKGLLEGYNLCMEIPWQEIDKQTLDRMLSELVTRDGTDYGKVEQSTEGKINSAMKRLQSGAAVLLWNEESESASLVSREELNQQLLEQRKLEKRAGMESG